MNKQAVKAPKPYGNEGRGIEVKKTDDYEADLEDKLSKMLNRNKHTEVLDASAKTKSFCQRCNQNITEDEKWVTALDKQFHVQCFNCVDCNSSLKNEPKYFDKGGQPQCPKCERGGESSCAGCNKDFGNEDATVQALVTKKLERKILFCSDGAFIFFSSVFVGKEMASTVFLLRRMWKEIRNSSIS